MISFTLDTATLDALRKKLEGIKPQDQSKAIYRGFVRSCMLIESRLKENVSGSFLHVRSGRLRSSIGSIVANSEKNGLLGTVGSGVRQGGRVPYAEIHETGGTITPTKGNWLTIPLPAAKTASGVARGRARDFENTFVRKSRTGNLIIFQRKGRSILPLFLLKKSVNIQAKKYLSLTKSGVEAEASQVLLDAVQQQIDER